MAKTVCTSCTKLTISFEVSLYILMARSPRLNHLYTHHVVYFDSVWCAHLQFIIRGQKGDYSCLVNLPLFFINVFLYFIVLYLTLMRNKLLPLVFSYDVPSGVAPSISCLYSFVNLFLLKILMHTHYTLNSLASFLKGTKVTVFFREWCTEVVIFCHASVG